MTTRSSRPDPRPADTPSPPLRPEYGAPPAGADPGRFYARRRRMAVTLDAMRRRYSAARATHPRKLSGSFVAPLDISAEAFATLRLRKVSVFVEAHQKLGYRLYHDAHHKILVETGAYPAFDLREHRYRHDVREYVVSAWFTYPNPKPLRIALPPWFTEPPAATPEKG